MSDLINSPTEEARLLIQLGAACWDASGGLKSDLITPDEHEIMCRWKRWGIIDFGEIAPPLPRSGHDSWVRLGPTAWAVMGLLLRDRSDRLWRDRAFKTAEEAKELV